MASHRLCCLVTLPPLLLLGFGLLGKVLGPLPAAAETGSPRPADSSSARASSAKMRAAHALYQGRCQKCHAEDGKGFATRARGSAIPDFSDRRWQQGRSDTQLLAGVLDGKGTHMPAFRGRISTEEARDQVAYIRVFSPTAPASDLDKQFRQLDEQLEKLRKESEQLTRPRNP